MVSREPNLEDVFLAQYGEHPIAKARRLTADARALARPSPIARVVGLGSIYGKTVRDSRRAALLVGGVAALFVIATGAPYATSDFATVEARKVFIASLTALPPAVRGLLGEPINLDTLGGFVSWRVGNFLPVMLGLWPVLALSGTLAGEAAKGSLDLLASTPHSRPSIALEKLAGHLTAVVFAMAILALAIFGVGPAFARLPGDEISFSAAVGQAALYGVMMLAAGGAAFATAPFLGRTRGLGVGLIVLFASYLIYGYSTLSPIIEALKPLSFFVWTAGHRPIAGVTDWPSVAALAAVDVVLFAIGVFAFTRRDLGASANVGWLRLPSLPAGIAGPFSRQLADRLGIALAWGVGVGAYGILIVASADAFGKMISSVPTLAGGHRGGLSGPRPDPAVGAAPADVLQLRVVHPRPGRRVVPRAAGRATRASSARGRPVDAAVACQLGGPQRTRRPGRDRRRDGHRRVLIGIAIGSQGRRRGRRRSSASGSSAWRPRLRLGRARGRRACSGCPGRPG